MKSQRKTTAGPIEGKIPPQAIELEQAVLGAIMIEPACLPVAMGLVSEFVFYKDQHQKIFSACKQLYDRSQPVDILTVTEKLRENECLDLVGGPYYVSKLTRDITSGLNVETHCRIILERYMKREIIHSSQVSINMAYDEVMDPFDCVEALEHSLQSIHEIMASGGNMLPVNRIVDDVEAEARKREDHFKNGHCTGIPTGIKQLDKLTAGWQKGELIILAGRPSMGKTALMLHHAISSKANVCIYSLEMPGISLVNRMILFLCDLDADKFKAGAMSASDWKEFYQAKEKLKSLPMHVDDNPVVTTRYIKSHSKLMKDRGKCDIIFVDYLQLVDMRSDQSGRNREQEVSQATRELKIIAKTLNVPVMVLAQLSRRCEMRGNKTPLLSDLRESGAIEQDADVVIFAYRPSYYDPDDQPGTGFEIIAKGRNVGVGTIPFKYNKPMTRIYDYVVSQEEAPPPAYLPYRNYTEKEEEFPF